MSQLLEQLEFAVSAFGKYWCVEGLHNLFDSHVLAGELVLCRTHQSKRTHTNGIQVAVSVWLALQTHNRICKKGSYLLVISKQVPKIWVLEVCQHVTKEKKRNT